jgi:DNA repair ATPase RecN
VITVLLVIGGVELNPGPPVCQGKIDQILAHLRNQEKSKRIKSLLESHKQEINKIKDKTRVFGPKCEKLIEAMYEVFTNYKQIEQAVKEWEEMQQMMDGKVSQLEDGHRKNIILIFGLEKKEGRGILR